MNLKTIYSVIKKLVIGTFILVYLVICVPLLFAMAILTICDVYIEWWKNGTN